MSRLWWYILPPFVAFSSLAVYAASVCSPRTRILCSELPAGSAEVLLGRMAAIVPSAGELLTQILF
jgi:hypothetical protein